ncbi:hypothetical protein EDB81DRAFT_263548 [Dactylonectria macrodidyma]|uniref:Secreted protein n=1 Tax=Dactylonectria macrodidyma TaxID=307937 RepID=A0A9P9FM69_9HYPO|nr:hypothetical protein EDB81DRAFT_263548 [Dactylonectria macrodidyma]
MLPAASTDCCCLLCLLHALMSPRSTFHAPRTATGSCCCSSQLRPTRQEQAQAQTRASTHALVSSSAPNKDGLLGCCPSRHNFPDPSPDTRRCRSRA